MKNEDLRKYDNWYRSAKTYAVDSTLRRFLQLPDSDVIPLSLSHGVDYGHCFDPMDVESIEPIHWCCNPEVYRQAELIKPSILLPHPWAIEASALDFPKGAGTLLVGPPPGPRNDLALYELVKNQIDSSWSILIKPRGRYCGSLKFWSARGVKPVLVALSNVSYYKELAALLGQYRQVVSATLSSVIFFAGAIGRNLSIVRDYSYEVYRGVNHLEHVNFRSENAARIASVFANGNQSEIEDISHYVLGYDFLQHARGAGTRLCQLIDSLDRPFHTNAQLLIPYPLREILATTTGRMGLLNFGCSTLSRRIFRPVFGAKIAVHSTDEFGIWLNGVSEVNFRRKLVKARRETRPGSTVSQYAE